MATRGPGAANLSIGVHTAHQDSTPMLVLLGDVETHLTHRGAFQEVDLQAFYSPITKLSMTATRGDRLPDMVSHALRVATTGRPGPVMISLPADLLANEFEESAGRLAGAVVRPHPSPSSLELAEAVKRLTGASRPVIIAGAGAQHARDDLVRVAERYHTGVYSSFRRQDVFPNDHPLYLGHLGVATPPETLEELRRSDLVLVLGCHLDQMTTQAFQLPAPSTAVIQVDVEPSSLGAATPLELGIVADPVEMLRALLEQDAPSPERSWAAGHNAYLRSATVGEKAWLITATWRGWMADFPTSDYPFPLTLNRCQTAAPGLACSVDDGVIRKRVNAHGVFKQPEEKQAPASRAAPVESEGELVEVVVQMLRADRPLMGADQPALQQRGHQVDPWEQLAGCLLGSATHHDLVVLVAASRKAGVARPSVGVNHTAGSDYVLNEA